MNNEKHHDLYFLPNIILLIEDTKNAVCVAYRGEKKSIHDFGKES